MIDEAKIRDLLVASCHSSEVACAYFTGRLSNAELLGLLMSIAEDADGGDAPMQAAYFVSQYPFSLLHFYEDRLLKLLPRADGFGGHVAVALGKTKSAAGKQLIRDELGDGKRFDAWLFKKALASYVP